MGWFRLLIEPEKPRPGSLQRTRSSHYRTQALCRVPVTLGKSPYILGKAFAECNPWQRSLSKAGDGKGLFAECLLSGTRQRLCRVPVKHSAKKSCLTAPIDGDGRFAERLTRGTRQSPPSLPSVSPTTLGKGDRFAEWLMGGTRQRQGGFVECLIGGTRQSLPTFA